LSHTDLAIGTFAQMNAQGLIEVIDEKTGMIVSVQTMGNKDDSSLKERMLADGTKILVDEQIDTITLKVISKNTYVFNAKIASVICQHLTEGRGFQEICAMPSMPPFYILQKWRKMYKDFDDAIEQSIKDQSYLYRDKALETIKLATTKEGDTDHKAIADMYLKLAEKGNPDRFGSRTKHVGDKDAPIHFTIETGVPQKIPDARPVGPGANEAAPTPLITDGVVT
jgi:hypothetical protein